MNRKLLRSVREYKREAFLTPVLVCLEVLMEVLIPLLMAKIIDVGIMNGEIGYIIRIGIALVALAMVSLFFGAKAGQLGAIAAAGYAKNLRHDIFYKSENHKQSDQNYHKRHEVGKFIKFKEGKADLAGKKILLVDDVCTTGSTLKACIKKIKDLNPLNLKVLVIAKRVFSEEELNELTKKEGSKNIEIV